MNNRYIELKGVKVNNLKNISLKIELGKFIVITGVSGSGKSSLAFDTLYAEGQRRYVESLSSYARQFLGRMSKPECDFIKGIPPAIAIEQKVNTSNPRSTVGTSTEIYDYLKLLWTRAGITYSPISGKEVKQDTPDSICSELVKNNIGKDIVIMSKCPDVVQNDTLNRLLNNGFARLLVNNEYVRIDDILSEGLNIQEEKNVYLVIDRILVSDEKETISRITESLETAMSEGNGECFVNINNEIYSYSSKFEADGIVFEKPNVNLFSFNSPIGACPKCNGYGKILGIDENLVVPNKSLSIYEDAIMCWRGAVMSAYKKEVIDNAEMAGIRIHIPYFQLTDKEKNLLWNGCPYFTGINGMFAILETQKYKIQNRVMIARYTGKTTCPLCHGTRLKLQAEYIKVGGKSLPELVNMQISDLKCFFDDIKLTKEQKKIGERILPEIRNRLDFLIDVGLGYLCLNRLSSSLSGGESQRINLATSLGSALVGSLYILDEPSIGLHSRDTERLIGILKKLRDLGNTVLVVEHDEDIIKSADQVIDIGPMAGMLGGELTFQGSVDELKKAKTLTAEYLFGNKLIEMPKRRIVSHKKITLSGVTENNLKNITVDFPLNEIVVVTGVSGSGKSTLITSVLVPALKKLLDETTDVVGSYNKLTGDLSCIKDVEYVDQNPIGKLTRSNPVTYIKVWNDIRKIFSEQKYAIAQGFKPSHFSFNTPGGRCEECQGEGIIKVSMQFMSDMYLVCDHCHGRRFKDDVLEVKYKDKNIFDILEMTVNKAVDFFNEDNNTERNIRNKLGKLQDVGLGYVKLGQPSSTLSGGECQRVKLAYHLSIESPEPTLFVFDEPTTGLHLHDIHKLMTSLQTLVQRGHSVIIIEHNMDVIKCADYIVDLGPDGGDDGGNLLFQGKPEDLLNVKNSYTAKYLKIKLDEDNNRIKNIEQ